MAAYKNSFGNPDHFDHLILDNNNNTVGTLRVKPSGLSWKAGKHKFYTVNLQEFVDWITNPNTKAKRTKS